MCNPAFPRSGTPRFARTLAVLAAWVAVGGAVASPTDAANAPLYALPASRVTRWQPGVPGGIPNYTRVHATIAATAHGNGAQDARPALQQALDAAGVAATQDGVGRVVLLSAGTFQISGELYLPSRVVLRGAGANATRLNASGNRHPLIVIGTQRWPHPGVGSTDLAVTGRKEENSVQLARTDGFAAGQLVFLDETTDNVRSLWNPRKHPPGAGRNWFCRDDRPITQILRIAAVNGDIITFDTPLHIDFRTTQQAQLSRFAVAPVWSAGLEQLRVSGGRDGNIQFDHAAGCWVSHVESDDSYGSCVSFRQSYRCELRDSYLHDSYYYNNGGAGYGVDVTFGSSDNLIENNIVIRFNKLTNCRASGGGNVIAYNYADDGAMNSDPEWVETGLQASHYPTPHFELFEGNSTFNLDGDFTEGNAISITFFRNHSTGLRRNTPRFLLDTGNRRMAGAMQGHYGYNFLGNVLGFPGMQPSPPEGWVYESAYAWSNTPLAVWRIGYWDGDRTLQDTKVGDTMIRDGNYDYVTSSVHWHHSPHFSGRLPDSLYLTRKPAFFGNLPWPWVDPLSAKKLHTLPARARFDAGKPND